jgi:hypothetical protein
MARSGEVVPEWLPGWLRVGSGAGILILGVTFIAPMIVRRAMDAASSGRQDDPLPPNTQTPDKANFLYPARTPIPVADVGFATVLRRRWKARQGTDLSPEGLAVLQAQAYLATNGGQSTINDNPVSLRADRFWTGGWTTIREPVWHNGRPSHRWAPIRAYGSLDAGVYDWLTELSPAALAAAEAGDPVAYVKELIASGWFEAPPEVVEPEFVAAAKLIRDKARGLGKVAAKAPEVAAGAEGGEPEAVDF